VDAMAAPRLDATPVGYAEWLAWPETSLPVEVVEGRAIMSPAPTGGHQRVVSRLGRILASAVPSSLEVLVGPVDWVISREPLTVRQPDLVVIHAGPQAPRHLVEPPLVAVEVASPSSRERDLVHKRAEYAAAGLSWYWLVDPAVPQVVVLRNAGGVLEAQVSVVGSERCALTEPFAVRLRSDELTRECWSGGASLSLLPRHARCYCSVDPASPTTATWPAGSTRR
jgi:Uma2 family endonuclease